MRITFAQLEALIWVARLGSFRRAAEHLCVSQPAITARILEFEHTIGGPLFGRTGHRPHLTALGRELLIYAERIEETRGEMAEMLNPSRVFLGPIRLGVTDSFATTCLSDLMSEVERTHPEARLDVQVDFSVVLRERLQQGALDIAVLTAVRPAPHLSIEPLTDLALSWVASPRMGLEARVFGPGDLADLRIITNPEPSGLFENISSWFAAERIQPTRLNTCNSLTIMTKLAIAGVGVSLLPTAILRHELSTDLLQVLQTTPAIAPHPLAVAYRRDYHGSGLRMLADIVSRLVAASTLVR